MNKELMEYVIFCPEGVVTFSTNFYYETIFDIEEELKIKEQMKKLSKKSF